MKTAVRKVAALGLALLVFGLPVLLSARERRGADLLVTLKDGQTVTGELIAVKRDSLLVLNLAGKDESVEIARIREIKVVKRSHAWKGALYGFLAGAAFGTVAYMATISGKESYVRDDYPTYGVWAMAPAVLGGLIGLGAGGLAGKDKIVRPEGMSESALEKVLSDLRTQARRPDFR